MKSKIPNFYVSINDFPNQDAMINRFISKTKKSDIIQEIFSRQFYVSKSEIKRLKKIEQKRLNELKRAKERKEEQERNK